MLRMFLQLKAVDLFFFPADILICQRKITGVLITLMMAQYSGQCHSPETLRLKYNALRLNYSYEEHLWFCCYDMKMSALKRFLGFTSFTFIPPNFLPFTVPWLNLSRGLFNVILYNPSINAHWFMGLIYSCTVFVPLLLQFQYNVSLSFSYLFTIKQINRSSFLTQHAAETRCCLILSLISHISILMKWTAYKDLI